MTSDLNDAGVAVAIIGMAGRFPGARDVDEFWSNLRDGKESISFFTADELLAEGKNPEVVCSPEYVAARGILEDASLFDADFFAMSPREAEIVDPQQRLFLECAWEALESAGYDASGHTGSVGVFAGESMSEHLYYLFTHRELLRYTGALQASFGNEKDYLATRTSYKLNLRGPSINVSNSCSTSLVAVHLACQSLLNGECDMALAGGVAINFPQKCGYTYEDGGILSPDGHCRPFDEKARGTVGGNGVGIVVLKVLADALAQGDPVLAVIRGSAINNDGAIKAGYTAPSIEGQANVIETALAAAGVGPETISYVEAHGTGTSLGDPIEVAALSRAFRSASRKQYCALGSVKSNIGHLDVAAGIAGLIKTVMALQRRMLPPTLHYERANPQIDFASSPFYVNSSLRAWPSGEGPRRAGISSFGIGGTNVHVVLEEAPVVDAQPEPHRDEVFLLSARTESALQQAEARLLDHLKRQPDLHAGDVAYTLAAGRKHFRHRLALHHAVAQPSGKKTWRRRGEWGSEKRPILMLLSGQGTQYAGMGGELYQSQPVFRGVVDRCAEFLRTLLDVDIRETLFSAPERKREATALLRQTWLTQPALFVIELATARLWESWGVAPDAMLGHSLGEIAAAALSGVFSEEDALRLVAARGRLMWATAPGAMLSALVDRHEAVSFARNGISIAAINAREQVVFSGSVPEIAALEQELEQQTVPCRRLEVERAFHSELMEPARAEFLSELARITFQTPQRRYLSNVTGRWAGDEVTHADYWWQQLRGPVHFLRGLELALSENQWLWVEAGPGGVLANLTNAELRSKGSRQTVVTSFGPEEDAEPVQMARAAAELWTQGADVDWARYYGGQRRRRVSLPTYPFERKLYQVPLPKPRAEAGVVEPAKGEQTMTATIEAAPVSKSVGREVLLVEKLRDAWASVLGKDTGEIDPNATFFELGVDSLLLIQVSKLIKDEFKIRIPFRQLLEEFNTLQSLAAYLDAKLAPDQFQPVVAALPVPAPPAEAASVLNSPTAAPTNLLESVIAQQTQIMLQQLEMVRSMNDRPATAEAPPKSAAPPMPAPSPAAPAKPEPFVPYQPIRPNAGGELTATQRRHLNSLIERYNRRTRKSKEHISKHRPVFADNRAMQGFRLQWKELVYPIVGARAEGSRIWDLDNNEYVDMTMGFGVQMFGHSPSFVTDAVRRQLDLGIGLGPQSHLAGQVAQGISELTGMQRVTFCNSGTEAVMAALRLSRLATGRSRIAMFAGSYHGTFDGNLARIERGPNGSNRTVAAGPGIAPGMIDDVTVLHYNEGESLDIIRQRASEFAAVLVEPIQSRRPDIQPREFLQELRKITANSGTALIFDDIVTGFRIHPGGTQAWFGIEADLATYGKVLAGGLPVGVVSGKPEFLDGIDGGMWNYGDGSYPAADQIIFAGTFCKHPLSMAACNAVLEHLKAAGPQLQLDLNSRATAFADKLNRLLTDNEVPMQVVNCGSLLRFLLVGNPGYMEIFFYHLIDEGVFVWEGRTAFVSTRHTDEDLEFVLRAFKRTIDHMRAGGFLQELSARPVVSSCPRSVPATEAQKNLWALAQLGAESSCAYNESFYIRTHHAIDPDLLTRALRQVVERHESLRTVFSPDGEHQIIRASLDIPVPILDLSGDPDCLHNLERAMSEEARTLFDLSQGPLITTLLVKLSDSDWQFAITAHHSVFDGWSSSIFLKDLDAFYRAGRSGSSLTLEQPMQFAQYVDWQTTQGDFAGIDESRTYWLRRFGDTPPLLELPLDQPRPSVYTHAGALERFTLDRELASALRAFCAQHSLTLFSAMLAAYTAFLGKLTARPELIVGIHSAGQTLVDGSDLIGHCINLLPLRSRVNPATNFIDHAACCKRAVFEAHEHQLYPYSRLVKDLNLRRDPSRLTLIESVFNLDQAVGQIELFGGPVDLDTNATGFTAWDLSWNVTDKGSDLTVKCEYNSDLFRPATIRKWFESYEATLALIVESPRATLAEINDQLEDRIGRKRHQNASSLRMASFEKLRNARRKTAAAV